MLDQLYQDLIIEHSQRSSPLRDLGPDSHTIHLRNPYCGDEVKVCIKLEGDLIDQIEYEANGCLISKASASMFRDMLVGKSVAYARRLAEDFKAFLRSDPAFSDRDSLGDLCALAGVKKAPTRIRCALLVFEAVERLVNKLS